MSDTEIPWTPSGELIDAMWAGDGKSDPIADQVPDMLSTIFSQQRHLMRAVWGKEIASGLSVPTAFHEWGMVEKRAIQARIHETFGHLVRELSEAMQHLDGSKSWKDNPRNTNVEEFYEEISDAFHFFIEFCILAGLDAEGLFREYFKKAVVNARRVQESY